MLITSTPAQWSSFPLCVCRSCVLPHLLSQVEFLQHCSGPWTPPPASLRLRSERCWVLLRASQLCPSASSPHRHSSVHWSGPSARHPHTPYCHTINHLTIAGWPCEVGNTHTSHTLKRTNTQTHTQAQKHTCNNTHRIELEMHFRKKMQRVTAQQTPAQHRRGYTAPTLLTMIMSNTVLFKINKNSIQNKSTGIYCVHWV